jgi:7-cyano-7-deazaguanine synthase in queuosine biosynthesis
MLDINSNFKYGIMLSGGLDSAILLYLILKENKNIVIQPFTIPKHDGSHRYVNSIVEYLKIQFDIFIPSTILIGDPEVHHTKQSTVAVKEIFKNYPLIDFLFFATNQNPIVNFDYSVYKLGGFPNRVKKSSHPKILMPFIEMYKDQILKAVFDNNQEKLLLLTHSCTEQKTGRCGQCFQCNERTWAFCQLDRIDPGIN